MKINFKPMENKPETPKVGVAVFLEREDGRILMILRKGSHGANKWALPGGHMEIGENSLETCRREVKEELGIIIDDVDKFDFNNTIFEDEGLHYVTLFFKSKWDHSKASKIRNMEEDKIAKMEWVDPSHPPEPIFYEKAKNIILEYGAKQEKKVDVIPNFILRLKEKEEKRKQYFISGEANKDIQKIKDYFKTVKRCQDRYLDSRFMLSDQNGSPITGDGIEDLVITVMRYAPHAIYTTEKDNEFSNEVYEYRDLMFRIMVGQGTLMQIWDKNNYENFRREISSN